MNKEAIKLCLKNLNRLSRTAPVPEFCRKTVRPGIVHLGVGGFHRSHQAVYTGRCLQKDPAFGICGVGLVPGDKKMKDALAEQDNLYTLVTKNRDSTEVEIIGSIVDYLYAGDGNASTEVVQRLASPDTRIVSLTVTEKAYMIDDSTGNLDFSHPLIVHDLEHPENPKTPVGYVVAGLRQRMKRGLKAFTVLSCDNLPMNGELTERVVLQFAECVDREDGRLVQWIKNNTSFPSTMVDRITPATTEADIEYLRKGFSIEDKWPVCAEEYTQWVIEDDFPLGRPDWEDFGALMVKDVKPYELMKLHLLNGSHSALAYLSYLKGHHSVHTAMEDEDISGFVKNYMECVTPTVPSVPGIDLAAYKLTLRERFSNPNVSDQVSRLCEDGSKKMQSFVRGALEELLQKGKPTKHVAGAVAGFIRHSRGVDELGQAIEVKDPRAEELRAAAERVQSEGKAKDFLAKFLSEDIASSARFNREVDEFLSVLDQEGGAEQVLKSLR